jgi:hypothetical protein
MKPAHPAWAKMAERNKDEKMAFFSEFRIFHVQLCSEQG